MRRELLVQTAARDLAQTAAVLAQASVAVVGVPPAPPAAASPRSGADGGASKRPSVFDPFNDGQPEPPEGVEDPEEANGDDEEDEDGAGMLELQATQQPDKQDLYEVVFEHETKLGMLLEKQEDWTPGTASEAPTLSSTCAPAHGTKSSSPGSNSPSSTVSGPPPLTPRTAPARMCARPCPAPGARCSPPLSLIHI